MQSAKNSQASKATVACGVRVLESSTPQSCSSALRQAGGVDSHVVGKNDSKGAHRVPVRPINATLGSLRLEAKSNSTSARRTVVSPLDHGSRPAPNKQAKTGRAAKRWPS